jgi:hypothetical protein
LKPPLEILVVRTEIRLGLLLVPIAESAYNVDRGDEARARGQAAYLRANRLLAQVADDEREPLVCDLELLQDALSGLPKDEQAGSVIRDHACPEKHLVVSLGQLPKKSRRSRSGCSRSLTQSCRDEDGGIDPRLGPKHSLFLLRMKSFLWQCGQQMPPASKPIYVTERSL